MAAGPDLTNPELWVARDGANYVLTDPVYSEPLNPNVVPRFIEDDPLLHAGLDCLRFRGDDVTVTLAYGAHQVAEDLGNVEAGWYERQVIEADYYGYEWYGGDADGAEERALELRNLLFATFGQNMSLEAFTTLYRARQPGMNIEFIARRDRGIALAPNTISFAADIPGENGTPIEQSIFEATNAVSAVGFCALLNAREWGGLARTGVEVLRGELGKPPRPVAVFETSGAAHRDKTRKFRCLGSHVVPKLVRPDKVPDATLAPIFERGAVQPDDLPLLTHLKAETRFFELWR